jgi:hypothetical protein
MTVDEQIRRNPQRVQGTWRLGERSDGLRLQRNSNLLKGAVQLRVSRVLLLQAVEEIWPQGGPSLHPANQIGHGLLEVGAMTRNHFESNLQVVLGTAVQLGDRERLRDRFMQLENRLAAHARASF